MLTVTRLVRSCLLFVAVCLALPFGSSVVSAEEPAGYSKSLFDGVSLLGWSVENDCEADVVDGCLRLKAGDG